MRRAQMSRLQPARLLCSRDFPGRNTQETVCHFILQGIFPVGNEPESPALTGGFFTSEPPGKPGGEGRESQPRGHPLQC